MSVSYSLVSINILIFCTFSVAFKKFDATLFMADDASVLSKGDTLFSETNIIAYFFWHHVCCCLDSQIFLASFFLQFFSFVFVVEVLKFAVFVAVSGFFLLQFFCFKVRMFAAFRICFLYIYIYVYIYWFLCPKSSLRFLLLLLFYYVLLCNLLIICFLLFRADIRSWLLLIISLDQISVYLYFVLLF